MRPITFLSKLYTRPFEKSSGLLHLINYLKERVMICLEKILYGALRTVRIR